MEAKKIPMPAVTQKHYDDVDPSHIHAAAIAAATSLGAVRGDTNQQGEPTGTFRPDDKINRAEVAAILSSAMGLGCDE